MGYRDYSTAKGHIVDATGHGDFTTIQAAITAASSGQTIFIRPGTYTEDLTLKAGVNLTAFSGDSINNTTTIIGKATASFNDSQTTISNLQLRTNSDFFLVVSGSNQTVVNILNCTLNCVTTTGISYTNSHIGSTIEIHYCDIYLSAAGASLYTMSAIGTLFINFCQGPIFDATTASTNSAGTVDIFSSYFNTPISTSSAGIVNIFYSLIGLSGSIGLTTAGTGTSHIFSSQITSGSAACMSIGSGTTVIATLSELNSSTTNVLTGSGTLNYSFLTFTGSSSGHNVTTENALATLI